MAEVVRMPKLSDTMTNGVLVKWHKKKGDEVNSGDLLADIETDKAVMEFESFQDGVLLYLGVKEGETVPVNTIIAILGEEGEDVKAILAEEGKKATAEKPEKVEEKEEAPKLEEKKTEPIATKDEAPVEVKSPSAQRTAEVSVGTHVKISPLAKKLAEEKGININTIKGTGDYGRIVKRDIDNYSGGGIAAAAFVGVEKYRDVPISQMRNAIARRLSESKFSAPHFYLTIDIDMDEMIKAREAINSVAGTKISFNDIIIKSVALSLKANPNVNASWLGDKIRYNEHVNIGVAVAVEDGLLVPVVRFADGKTLTQIAGEVKDFAEKAKSKKLQPKDWEGSTFTISNLGMYGIDEFTAIINSPDACILAVGGIKQTPVVKKGQVVPGNVLKVTLSCDHRAVDGATGAAFLQTLKHNMENPVLLLGASSI